MSEVLFLILFLSTIVIVFFCCTFIQGQKETEQILSFFEKLKTGNILVININNTPRYFAYINPILDYENRCILLYPEYKEVVNFDIGKIEVGDCLKVSFDDIVLREERYKILKYTQEK